MKNHNAAQVTSGQRFAVRAFERTGYEPLEKQLAREHTTTAYLAQTGVVVVYREGLAEQLAQHTPRGRYA